MERCGLKVDDHDKMRSTGCLKEITGGATIEDAPERLGNLHSRIPVGQGHSQRHNGLEAGEGSEATVLG